MMPYTNIAQTNIVVFHDPAYPNACSDAVLAQLIPGKFEIVHAADLADHLSSSCDVLVSFHGPYFPKQAWKSLLQFLEQGGNLAIFGGIPFTRPVLPDGTIEPEQQAYTDRLYLGPAFKLDLPASDLRLVPSHEAAFLAGTSIHLPEQQHGTFWSFYPMLTQVSDHPDELGSAGPLDTVLTPLLFAQTDDVEQPLATPIVMLDQHHGHYKGGRWLLSPWKPVDEDVWLAQAEMIQQCITLAAEGCNPFAIHPLFACYQPGETPTCVISSHTRHDVQVQVTIYTPQQEELASFEHTIAGSSVRQERRIQLPVQNDPGFYKVVLRYTSAVPLAQETGFWVWDQTLIENTSDKKLTPGRDYFYQHNQPFLIFGTTYMDSRVQRKYLFHPNPARWESDFAEMKNAGINLIRTGIWTDWRSYMSNVGSMDEGTMRAFDAFVMTACKYNLQVIFTFFSFYPPLFEGINPWLDPRSIEGQKEFVTAFAHRYASAKLVSWDLINEPSFGDPKRIFSQRPLPNYDRFELAAFRNWLKMRYTIEELQVRWRQTPANFSSWAEVMPPVASDYSTNPRDTSTREMLKVMDYTMFSQEMFRIWADDMRTTIHAANSSTMVGVGQDESGSRISPQFYAPAVDYTTTHPWWNNDDLLWDMLLDKTLDTPNLIQEIGVMLIRDVDKRPWRSEQENANLLERKLITGLIARGAGLIQWLWHTNADMTIENENSIGLVRADGSAKPELHAMLGIGALIQALDTRFVETTTPPDVWVIAPYSQWFLRPDLAIEATRQSIRVLGYEFGIIPQVIAEHQLSELSTDTHRPHTIILPSIQTLPLLCWELLMKFVEEGTTLFVSGALSHDQHNLLEHFHIADTDGETVAVPVSRYERLTDDSNNTYQLLFSKDKMGYVRKAHNSLRSYHRGAGTIIWSGLPLELSEHPQGTQSIYAQLFGLPKPGANEQSSLLAIRRPLKDGSLVLLVSESSDYSQIMLTEGTAITIAPNRAGAVIIEQDGSIKCFGGVQPVN